MAEGKVFANLSPLCPLIVPYFFLFFLFYLLLFFFFQSNSRGRSEGKGKEIERLILRERTMEGKEDVSPVDGFAIHYRVRN